MTIKSSLVIPHQLPSYIREGVSGNRISQTQITPYNEDYQTFVSFLQAYYEFLESSGNVYGETKNIISYKDIDRTISQFEQYFFNEFLQYFPEESLTDKKFLTKFSKQLYERKGTPSSIKFLFRALFNSDCELYNTRESVLVASGGKWVRSKFVRLNSLDQRFLSLQNYKLFGETSKSIGRIQRAQVSGNRTEVFLSDIVREFESGEYITVVDDHLTPILFDGQKLSAKVVGVVSKVEIDPNFRGLLYKTGDPAIIVGGLNPDSEFPKSATVEVGEITTGSVTNITLKNGSNGFRTYSNTIISFSGGGGGSGANAIVSSVDSTKVAKVTFIANDVISLYANTTIDATSYGFVANPSSNANTQLKDAFSFISVDTFPISELELVSRGINYASVPKVDVQSYVDLGYDKLNIKEFGILSPTTVLFGGFNYSNGDIVLVSGGSGFGAYANVKSVNANGSIETIQYQYNENDLYPLGGMFYKNDNLPTLSIESANNKIISLTATEEISSGNSSIKVSSVANVFAGMYISGNGIAETSSTNKPFGYYTTNTTILFVDSSNNEIIISNPLTSNISNSETFIAEGSAVARVTSILGDGEELGVEIDNIGSIKTFNIIDQGEDYISNPSVVLKILDVAVINVNELDQPDSGELIYQGDASSATFKGFVDSITKIPGQIQTTYYIRIYSYNGGLDSSNLYIDRNGLNSKTLSFTPLTTYNQDNFVSGIKIYGDGSARANAEFINGTILLQGKYQNEDGFLSSQSVLQSDVFNNYTYSLTVEKEFEKYKQLLYKILHPAGKKVSARNAIKSNNSLELFGGSDQHKIIELKYLTHPTVYGVLVEPNKLQIYDLYKEVTRTYLSGVLTTNTYISLTSTNSEKFYSKVERVDDENDVIYLSDHNILEYANVSYGYSNGNSVIVTKLTGNYDLINNGEYNSAENYMREMVYANDSILISNNYVANINSIDYVNRIIYANTELNYSGNANTPSLITVTRSFVANSILVDYRFENNYLAASGNTVTEITIDGFYVIDESNNLIYVLTEN